MTKISLDSETRPLLFFLLVLPSSTTQFSLGEARRFQDRKIFKRNQDVSFSRPLYVCFL